MFVSEGGREGGRERKSEYKIQIIPEAEKNLSEISVFSNLP